MAMSKPALTKEVLNAFRANMKKLDPKAEATPFQEKMCKAYASGVIDALKASTVTGPPTPQVAGTGIAKGYTVDGTLMSKTATLAMAGFAGGAGKALDLTMQSFMKPLAKHLKDKAEVVSTNGFGGQGSITNSSPIIFELAIIKEMGPDAIPMLASLMGPFFLKALGIGINAGVAAGKAGLISFGSTPPAAAPLEGKLR